MERQKELNERYLSIISDADNSFKKEKLLTAKDKYMQGLEIKPDESYPKAKIAEIDKLLDAALSKEKMLALENKYNAQVRIADKEFRDKHWSTAIFAYEDALEIKPNEKYPKSQIIEIEKIQIRLAAEKELQQKQNEYKNLISEADDLFIKLRYTSAKDKYQLASNLFSSKSYPRQKIIEINKLLKAYAEQKRTDELNKKYESLIREADIHFINKTYTTSRKEYVEATELKPKKQYPKARVAEIDLILSRLSEERKVRLAIDESYNKKIEIADFQFESQQWEASKTNYFDASGIKPDQKYPKERIREINRILTIASEKAKHLKETEDAYVNAIERADKALGFMELKVASFYYQKAAKMRSFEEYPKIKIKEVDSLFLVVKQQKIDNEFVEAIDKGDIRLSENEFSAAKFFYHKASEIKPDDELPQKRLAKLEIAKMASKQVELTSEYSQYIEKAEQYVKEEFYSLAEYYFEKANYTKPNEELPVKRLKDIAEIKDKLEFEKKQIEYLNSINLADKHFDNEDYTAARFFYRKALDYNKEATYPQEQLEKIESFFDPDYIAKMVAYNKAIYKADRAFDYRELKLAKSFYEEALLIKPKDKHATEQLLFINKKLDVDKNQGYVE